MPHNRSYELMDDRLNGMEKGDPWYTSSPHSVFAGAKSEVAGQVETVKLSNFHRRSTFENSVTRKSESDTAAYAGPSAYSAIRRKAKAPFPKNGVCDKQPVLKQYDDNECEGGSLKRKWAKMICLVLIILFITLALAIGIYYAVILSEEDGSHISDVVIAMHDFSTLWISDFNDQNSGNYKDAKTNYEANVSLAFKEQGYETVVNVTDLHKYTPKNAGNSGQKASAYVAVIFTVQFRGDKRPSSVTDIISALSEYSYWCGVTVSEAAKPRPVAPTAAPAVTVADNFSTAVTTTSFSTTVVFPGNGSHEADQLTSESTTTHASESPTLHNITSPTTIGLLTDETPEDGSGWED